MGTIKTIRITSDSVDMAIRRAEQELKLPREQLEITVVQNESKGLLRRQKAMVEFSYDVELQESRAKELEISRYLDLKITGTGIYLKIDPIPDNLKERASYNIRRYLSNRNIISLDSELIKRVIDLQCGKHVLILRPRVDTIGTAKVSILRSADNMLAILIRYDREPLDVKMLEEYLTSQKITYGIRKDILANLPVGKAVVIAEGEKSITDIRAPLEYLFDRDVFAIRFDEQSQADYRNVLRLTAVKKGQWLARKGAPVPGKTGRTVDGTEIPFDVERDGPIPHGPGTSLTPDGTGLVSDIDGHVFFEGGIVSVEALYVVEGDVDYHTGNITFDGGVVVTGDVRQGFQVSAKGNVEIHGVVDGGIIESDGNIIVRQGIFAKDTGSIRAGGTLLAKHIEGMKITAKRVRVYANILNADVKAEEYVEVFGDPGAIIGGRTEARYYIKANTFGSTLGHKTVICAGNSDELTERLNSITASLKDKKSELVRISAGLDNDSGDGGSATTDVIVKQTTREIELKNDIEYLETLSVSLKDEERRLKTAKVHFRDYLYEGIRLGLFNTQIVVSETKKRGSAVWENDAIKIIHYHYVEGG